MIYLESHDNGTLCTKPARALMKVKKKSSGKLKIIKKKIFSHLFQSIFNRSLVLRMNESRLNYTVLIKVDRIWGRKKEEENLLKIAEKNAFLFHFNCNLKRIMQ